MELTNEMELSTEPSLRVISAHQHHDKAEFLKRILEQKKLLCESIVGNETSEEGFCSTIWDQVYCWPKTKAGQVISTLCPEYIVGFNLNASATKYCTDDGQWYSRPETGNIWTNYTQCIQQDIPEIQLTDGSGDFSVSDPLIAKWLPIIKKISQVGYGLSLGTLLIAFFILASIKKLRCPRNTLHMHLFVSFMLRAFMALLKDTLFIDGVGLPQSIVEGNFIHSQPNWECKLVTSLWQYFILANYFWVLMEGAYLYLLLFLSPFSDSSAITIYVILGWGCPFLVVGSWVTTRILLDDTYCWTSHHQHADLFLIIRIPIILTIVLNFFFFLNIARVLLLKLQSAVSIESRKYRYRKWARSTLVLVPLFGVHYMIFIGMSYYMGVNPVIEVIWLFCDQFFASFQGFFVSILYCLLNGEVRSELGKKWNTWKTETEVTNVWVPLNHITNKFYQRSNTNDDIVNGLSGTSTMGVLIPNRKSADIAESKMVSGSSRTRRQEQEITEEHQMDVETLED